MAIERTLSIIKPDAVERNLIGKICARFEEENLTIAAMRKVHLSRSDAEGFYAVHSERPFFGELVEFMTRSPVVVMVLEGENAVARNREIMGPQTQRMLRMGHCVSFTHRALAKLRTRFG